MTGCIADPATRYIRRTLSVIDCHANGLAGSGFEGVAGAGSGFSIALGGILAIAVAVFGYRMILGETPTLRTSVTTLARIGILLALVGIRPGIQTLLSDTVLLSPAQMTREVGEAAGVPGGDGSLIDRLDRVATAIDAIIAIDARRAADAAPPPSAANVPLGSPLDPELPPRAQATAAPVRPTASVSLTTALLILRVSAVAGFGALHAAAAVLLALAPFFVAALLFDIASGLAWGWARMLGATILGGIGVALSLGIGVAVVQPPVLEAAARATRGGAIDALAREILTTTVIVALVEAFMIVAAITVATGLRMPARLGGVRAFPTGDGRSHGAASMYPAAATSASAVSTAPPRVMQIADALSDARRDRQRSSPSPTAIIGARYDRPPSLPAPPAPGDAATSRSPFARPSASGERRDKT